MTKENVEVKDNVITLQDIENKKHVFHIDDIFSITLLPMDNRTNPCSVKYLSLEEDKDIGCKTLETAIITKKQFDGLKDILDKTRYKPMTKSDYINKIVQINLENDRNIKVEVKDIVGLIYSKFNDTEYDGKILYQVTLQTAPNHLGNYNLTINEWLNLKELLDYYVEETHSKKKVAKSTEPDNEFSHYSSRFSITYDWKN